MARPHRLRNDPKPKAPKKPDGGQIKQKRWTIAEAAPEFDISHMTLAKKLKVAGTQPGEDGKYCTMDICRARFGDFEFERIRKMREDADSVAMDNEVKRKTLIPTEKVYAYLEEFAVTLKQSILILEIPNEEKDAILKEIHGLLSSHAISAKVLA